MYKDFATGLEKEFLQEQKDQISKIDKINDDFFSDQLNKDIVRQEVRPTENTKKIMKLKSINIKKRSAPVTPASTMMFNKFLFGLGPKATQIVLAIIYMVVLSPSFVLLVFAQTNVASRANIVPGEEENCDHIDLPWMTVP